MTRGYRELQEVTGGDKRLQGVTKGYSGLQGVTLAYKGLQKGCSLTRTSPFCIKSKV